MFQLPDSDDALESGLERLAYGAFFRKYNKFRTSDLTPRFRPFPEDFQLPQGSILHIWDNMYNRDNHLPVTDLPNLNIPLIKNDPFRKFIYHIVQPDVLDESNPIVLPNDYVYRNMNLNQNLIHFRKDVGSKYRFVTNPMQIPASPMTLTIVNYNPMFRVFARGILPVYRQFKVILGTILNTMAKIENKYQYLIVPLSHQVYTRDKFMQSERAETMQALKSKNSFHYFFMVQWLNFISTISDLSFFEKYPAAKWATTNILFTAGGPSSHMGMLWSLHDAQELNQNNKFYLRYVNQINALVLASLGTEIKESGDNETSDTEEEISKITKEKNIVTDTEEQEIKTQAPEGDEELPEDDVKSIEEQKQIVDQVTATIAAAVAANQTTGPKPFVATALPVPDVPDNYDDEPAKNPLVGVKTPPTKKVLDKVDEAEAEEISAVIDQNTEFQQLAAEATDGILPTVTPIKTPEAISQSGKQFLDDIDKDVHQLLLKHPDLTPKQKERLRNIAQASKSVKLNGKTIEEHLTQPVNPNTHANKLDFLEDHLVDPSMATSSIKNFDEQYMKNFFERDLASVALSLNKSGMFLTGVEEVIHSDELNRLRKFKFTYHDINGKSHTVKFDLPHIDENGMCLINGVRCVLRKQMANLPICKVSPVRVSLASNYNKTVVERNEAKAHNFLSYFQRLVNKINDDASGGAVPIKMEYGGITIKDRVAYEYSALASVYKLISVPGTGSRNSTFFSFDYPSRLDGIPPEKMKMAHELEKTYGTYIGVTSYLAAPGSKHLVFIHPSNILTLYDPTRPKEVKHTTFIDMFSKMFDTTLSSRLSEWTDIKILDKKFPVGFLLCFEFGLLHTLQYLGVKYQIVSKRGKTANIRPSDIVIPFKDQVVIVPRYPLRNSLIMAGLLMFSTKDYMMEDFETKDVYYQLLLAKGPGFRTNYLKGIEDTFELFVDPMTKDVLEQMGEPVTFKDLLIRATDMLVTEDHHEASSMKNHRFRSYERLNAIVYNEISRQFAAYHRKAGKGSSFSINPNAVLQRILQDQAMSGVEDINPIHEIKVNTGFTYSGMGGRTQQSFVINDRRYPDDAMGIISEATADSGSVAITAIAPADPTIANVRGILEITPKQELDPSQILSTTSLLMPGATQDD